MKVGIGSEGHRQVPTLCRLPQGAQVPTGVHGQSPTIAETQEIGGVAQPLVDQRNQIDVTHSNRLSRRTTFDPLFHRLMNCS